MVKQINIFKKLYEIILLIQNVVVDSIFKKKTNHNKETDVSPAVNFYESKKRSLLMSLGWWQQKYRSNITESGKRFKKTLYEII